MRGSREWKLSLGVPSLQHNFTGALVFVPPGISEGSVTYLGCCSTKNGHKHRVLTTRSLILGQSHLVQHVPFKFAVNYDQNRQAYMVRPTNLWRRDDRDNVFRLILSTIVTPAGQGKSDVSTPDGVEHPLNDALISLNIVYAFDCSAD